MTTATVETKMMENLASHHMNNESFYVLNTPLEKLAKETINVKLKKETCWIDITCELSKEVIPANTEFATIVLLSRRWKEEAEEGHGISCHYARVSLTARKELMKELRNNQVPKYLL